jgi:hypothetical protein
MMEQIKNLEDLSAYFYGLADGSIDPFNNMYGICYQVDELFERGIIEEDISESYYLNELFLDQYFESWNGYSGEPAYPVPSTDEMYTTAGEMFDSVVDNYGDMWTGDYGDLRKDLCRHIAKEIEVLIEVN